MHHSFDIGIATKYGINVAIFLNNMFYWIQKNQIDKTNYHEGRYWTYNTSKYFTELFPYWSEDQVDRIIKKCVSEGLVLTGNFNEFKYDRTRWYALTDLGYEISGLTLPQNCGMDTAELRETFRETAGPIPNINSDINTNKIINSRVNEAINDSFNEFWGVYPKKVNKHDALKAWKKIKVKPDFIIADVLQRTQHDWRFRDKQHIPNAASYLNGERWNDEIIAAKESTNGKRSETSAEKCWRISQESLQRDIQREATRATNDPIKLDYDHISAVPRNLV